ncbi:MAG TPA: type II CAAX endopeptidase family protein [Gemmatimonadaceae bacterium]|nr:type II CAAX endopeptidase family protein [Gemmatimonadaceae bacterium]
MPALVDVVFVVVLVVLASIFEYVYFWPRFRADVAAGKPSARVSAYRRGVVGEWVFTIAAIAIWTTFARPWSAMRFVLPHGWRLGVGVVFVLAAVGLVVLQLWSVARLPAERRIRARPKLGNVGFMLPHTAQEQRWFLTLSMTAGFCEELLYRGYLPWFFAPWLGSVGAMALVVILFGIGHAYQGRAGTVRATLAGAFLAALVLVTGSLIPAMIVHALIDIGSGTLGYWLLRDYPETSAGVEPAAASRRSTLAAL